jgi:hypothetical protein
MDVDASVWLLSNQDFVSSSLRLATLNQARIAVSGICLFSEADILVLNFHMHAENDTEKVSFFIYCVYFAVVLQFPRSWLEWRTVFHPENWVSFGPWTLENHIAWFSRLIVADAFLVRLKLHGPFCYIRTRVVSFDRDENPTQVGFTFTFAFTSGSQLGHPSSMDHDLHVMGGDMYTVCVWLLAVIGIADSETIRTCTSATTTRKGEREIEREREK